MSMKPDMANDMSAAVGGVAAAAAPWTPPPFAVQVLAAIMCFSWPMGELNEDNTHTPSMPAHRY